jgi:GxxExxY protein
MSRGRTIEVSRGAAEDAEKNRPLDDVTGAIVDASYKIHTALGPGLLESVYELVLARELARRGLLVERQREVSFEYDGLRFDNAFRVDLLVDHRVVVEIKSLERAQPVHAKQLLTYLRLLNLRVGLLVNFGAASLKEGLARVVNGLAPSAAPREPVAACVNRALDRLRTRC